MPAALAAVGGRPVLVPNPVDEQGAHVRASSSRYDEASLGVSSRTERNVW